MSDMEGVISNLLAEAQACDERSIKLREAVDALTGITLTPRPKLGRPAVSSEYKLGGVDRLLRDIPVKASKKTGKKRKYTKRSAFWKKKK